MSSAVDQDVIQQLADALAIWNKRYRLLCGKCWKDSRLQSRKITREDAGNHFFEQGWRFSDGIPVCPNCTKLSN
jgi:hypothetical protein